MKLVFCGTPEFAVPTLEAVLAADHEVALVLTQPDRPSGRGMQLAASPVKQFALMAGIGVAQPAKLRTNEDLRQQLAEVRPDAILVVAYGRIIPSWMLTLPPHGNLNLHGSLLPRYRGAAPIQWAIARGETVTGVTTMRLDEGLDTGDMLLQREVPVGGDQTAAELYPRLAHIGAELMVETLKALAAGTLQPRPQSHAEATLAPILTREDGRIDAAQTAQQVYNRWRGFQPWPGAWGMLAGKKLTVTRMTLPAPAPSQPVLPGSLVTRHGSLYLACGEEASDASTGFVELVALQPEGKRSMPAADWLRGNPLPEGAHLD